MDHSIRSQIQSINVVLSSILDIYGIWAKKNGLSYNALAVLYTLDSLEECTQKQICASWALPKQTVHGILQEFEKKGYVVSHPNLENKRERLLSFTETGQAYANTVLEPLYRMEERAMEQMGEGLRQMFVESNTSYCRLLRQEVDRA